MQRFCGRSATHVAGNCCAAAVRSAKPVLRKPNAAEQRSCVKYNMKIWELLQQWDEPELSAAIQREAQGAQAPASCCATCKTVLARCGCGRRQKAKPAPRPKMVRWPRPKKLPKKKKPPKRSQAGYVKPRAAKKPSGSVGPPKPQKWK